MKENPLAYNTYLGDGVYAQYVNGQIWLRTERLRSDGTLGWDEIAFEPSVHRAYIEFSKKFPDFV